MKAAVLVCLCLAVMPLAIDAYCCSSPRDWDFLTCCGMGPCNALCCNCDGPRCDYDQPNCRVSLLLNKMSNIPVIQGGQSEMEKFSLIDSDKNGFISLAESSSYLGKQLAGIEKGTPEWFTSIDKNGDGILSPTSLTTVSEIISFMYY